MPESKKDLNHEKFLQLADVFGNDSLVKHDDPEACINRAELLDEFITAAEAIGYSLHGSANVTQDIHSQPEKFRSVSVTTLHG